MHLHGHFTLLARMLLNRRTRLIAVWIYLLGNPMMLHRPTKCHKFYFLNGLSCCKKVFNARLLLQGAALMSWNDLVRRCITKNFSTVCCLMKSQIMAHPLPPRAVHT